MNQSNAKQFLPLVQALAEGKIIQYKNSVNNQWKDMDCGVNIAFSGDPDRYRIKREPVKVAVQRIGVVNLEPEEGDDPWVTSFPNQRDADDYIRRSSRGRTLSTFPLTGSYER